MHDKYHEYMKSSEKINLNTRLIQNEKWFRKKQDELQTDKNKRIPGVKGGYLFNAIITKHADAMDNYPDISILPREEKDKELAKTLTGVIPYVLDRCNFEKVYSDNWYSKLKTSSCYSVIWDQEENDGKGDIKITKTDLLNFCWQPNVCDIQQSDFVFYHTYIPRKLFIDTYGQDKLEETETITTIDTYETASFDLKAEFILIVDCYYKKKKGKKTVVHFAKFSGYSLLYSSEDEKNEDGSAAFPNGYYDHGKYPFVFDVMYPAEQSIAGFGVVDIAKDTQLYIDATDELIQINNRIVGKPRMLFSKSLGINSNDLVNLDKEFIEVNGGIDQNSIYKFPVEPLPSQVINSLQNKKDELKEIIGNRDFQQGGTTGGVTSGSAISILQSAGDKLGRDMIKSSYRAYKQIILLVIELIRQFYDEERTVRITGQDGNDEFIRFSNKGMKSQSFSYSDAASFSSSGTGLDGTDKSVPYNSLKMMDLGAMEDAPVGIKDNLSLHSDGASPIPANGYDDSNVPLFDVRLCVQKSNPYSRELNNQTIITLADKGLLNPQNFEINLPTLNALQFDGKDELIKELRETFEKMKEQEMQKAAASTSDASLGSAVQPSFAPQTPPSPQGEGFDDELIDITDMIGGE